MFFVFRMDGQTDRQMDREIDLKEPIRLRCMWAGGIFFHCLTEVPPARMQQVFL
jgi:hypothetical protein